MNQWHISQWPDTTITSGIELIYQQVMAINCWTFIHVELDLTNIDRNWTIEVAMLIEVEQFTDKTKSERDRERFYRNGIWWMNEFGEVTPHRNFEDENEWMSWSTKPSVVS
jgi:hypothetical protein